MNRFKKRTIALVLASVVSVVGAFGANNFKNTIMDLSFEDTSNGSFNMVVHTKNPFSGNLKPTKIDANTYILMLPEINSEAPTPNLDITSGKIQSVNVRTMPYSANSNGYTKITIKTNNPSIGLNATTKIFIPKLEKETFAIENKTSLDPQLTKKEQLQADSNLDSQYQLKERRRKQKIEQQEKEAESIANSNGFNNNELTQQEDLSQPEIEESNSENDNTTVSNTKQKTVDPRSTNASTEKLLLILSSLLIFLISIFCITKARDKMKDIAGEGIDIELDDESKKLNLDKKKKKEKEKEKRKKVIKKPKILYKDMGKASPAPFPQAPIPSEPIKTVKPAEELNIIDLDEAFQKHQLEQETTSPIVEEQEEEENAALEDFLSGFSFDEEFGLEETIEDESNKLINEYYEQLINSDNITFSKSDLERINQLLDLEINDDTKRNIEKYAISNPISKKPTKKQILEELVTTYAISQHITFTSEDVKALYQLISIEIDKEFLADIRTNPEKIAKIKRKHTETDEGNKKNSLNIKDMLPDLSDALKKQNDASVESKTKTNVNYANEGLEVKKLKFNDMLPDLSAEIHKPSSYVSKPSMDYELADNSYEVKKITITTSLPDLNDVLTNPDKYKEKEVEKAVADEESLLKNINNVEFKPFYDGTQEFEVLNEIPDANEIQNEFSQFENFEIHHDDYEDNVQSENDYDDFKEFFNEDYVDLDSQDLSAEFAAFFENKETVYQGPVVDDEENEKSNNDLSDLELEQALSIDSETETIEEDSIGVNNIDINETEELPVDAVKESVVEEKIILEEKIEDANLNLKYNDSEIEDKSKKISRSQELIKRIEETKAERKKIKEKLTDKTKEDKKVPGRKEPEIQKECTYNGINYNIVSSVGLTDNIGCHLAKNENGYLVFGYVGDRLVELMPYEALKSEKIQARVNEKVSETEIVYIIRIGLNKFLVKVDDNNIEFVMNLC